MPARRPGRSRGHHHHDIALIGRKKLDLLRRFRPFAMGTPAHDRLVDILALLDPEQSERCFVSRVAALIGTREGVAAIDGKTARRSGRKTKGQDPIGVILAFATGQRLVMGPVKVAQTSNELIAIPKLHGILSIEGAIVTIDAVGCQRTVAAKIREQKAVGFKDSVVSRDITVDGDHGRIETRNVTVIHDVDWLKQRHDSPGLNAVFFVESQREIGDTVERETRLYITSLVLAANLLGRIVRRHWLIEN